MSDKEESNIKEIYIVKRKSNTDAEDYVSIQLRSSKDSVDELLQKAMTASKIEPLKKDKQTPGVQ